MEQTTNNRSTQIANAMNVDQPKKSFSIKRFLKRTLLVVAALWIVLAISPTYQNAVLYVRKYIFLILLSAGLLYLAYRILRSSKRLHKKAWAHWTLKGVLPLLIIGFLASWFTPFMQKRYHEAHMWYLYNRLDKQEITQLPLTRYERIHPRNNIQTMAYSQLGSNFDISKPQLIHDKFIDSTDNVWSMAVLPIKRNMFQPYEDNINDIFVVPSHKSNPDFVDHRLKVTFNTGESMKLDKNVYNTAIKALGFKFFYMEPDDVYYMHDDAGKPVQVVSLIKWTGFLFPIPKFGGVIVIPSKDISAGEVITRDIIGYGKYISPDEFSKYPYLDGNNLFSEEISRMYAESFTYKDGYYHAKLDNQSAVEIPNLPTDENEYPFVSDYDWSKTNVGARNGLYHYISLEPVGENHKGMAYSIFIPSDGRGKIYYYDHVKAEDGVGGVTSMPNIIRSFYPTFDWSHSTPAEFRTYMPNIPELPGTKNFFWLGSIVTISHDTSTRQHDGATLAKLVVVNARKKDVIEVDAQHPDNWVNQIRSYYGLPIKKDTIAAIPLTTKADSIPSAPVVQQPTPTIPVPVPQDTMKKVVAPVQQPAVEVKKDTPVAKVTQPAPVVKQQPKQKSKNKKKKG